MSNQLLGSPRFRAWDTNGNPLAGGKLYSYFAGTTTPKSTYSDNGLTANTNPVLLNPEGEAVVYLSGQYKLVLKTPDDVTMWTMDNVGQSTPGLVFPEDFGAVGDGITDDSAAIAACYAALSGGTMQFSAKTYKTSGSLTLKTGCGIMGAGIGATTINYSGSDYWLKVPTLTKTDSVALKDFYAYCSGSGLGILQHQDPAQVIDATAMSQWWTLSNLRLVGNEVAGSIGLSLTELGDSASYNIDVSGFATQILNNVTTRFKHHDPKVTTAATLANSIGIEERGAGYTLQDDIFNPTVLLQFTGAIGIKVDTGAVGIHYPFYEKLTTANAKCFLWLTENATAFDQEFDKYAVSAGTIDNLILADNAATLYLRGVFHNSILYGTGAGLTCSFGTTGSEWAWQFDSPGESLGAILHDAVVAKRVAITGGHANTVIRTPGACNNVATPISIATATPTAVIFDGTAWDNDAMVNLATQPTRITITTPGIYSITANAGFASNSSGYRSVRVSMFTSGSVPKILPLGEDIVAASSGGTFVSASGIYDFAAGDYLEMEVTQTSGGPLNLSSARLAAQRLSHMD